MQPVTERHVQAIWYDGALRPRNLLTRRGSEVRVVDPGTWNTGAGPDFTDAVLEVGRDRRRVVGDVEIHLAPGDWDGHGHGADPRYRHVIAHVTWGCGPVPRTLPPGCLSIWLGRFKTAEPDFSPEQIDLLAYPYARLPAGERPCSRRFGHEPDIARQVLAEAGRRRLRQKAQRLLGRLCERAADRDGELQVFYEEVMNAFGYSRNTRPFRRVAERLPVAALPEEVGAAEMAMLVAGGFEEWDRLGLRPHNAPERRLADAARTFRLTPTLGFCAAQDFSRDGCRTIVREMCAARSLGRGRAAAVLANVIVPFALAAERISRVPDWLPAEDISAPVRLTAFRLFGRDHSPAAYYADNGLLVQGLLQIHRDYCLQVHPDCETCGLAKLV